MEQIMDLETGAVMLEHVKVNTRAGYTSRLLSLMIWLYRFGDGKRYSHLIREDLVEKMNKADIADKATMTKKGEPSKRQTQLFNVCARSLGDITPLESSPIKLESLSFQIFTRYLSTFKKNLPEKRGAGPVSESKWKKAAVDVAIGGTTTIRLAAT